MAHAVVIMSTFNGEKYLREQLDSILNQTGVDVSIVIRDDGSSDSTCDIIKDYKNRHQEITCLQENNVGCKKSFYIAAQHACSTFPDAAYFAFSDQDDFWMAEKLKCGIEAIKKLEEDSCHLPLLYFCAPEIVDSTLSPIGKKWNSSHFLNFEEACIAQPCAGCTMIFNRKALELFLLASPDKMSMHDSWMYKTVLACGGIVTEDPTPHIKYRQHGNNVIGTGSFSSRWKRRFHNFAGKSSYRSRQVKFILENYAEMMPESIHRKASILAGYKDNGFASKMRILLSPSFCTKDHIHNILFRTAILFNRF